MFRFLFFLIMFLLLFLISSFLHINLHVFLFFVFFIYFRFFFFVLFLSADFPIFLFLLLFFLLCDYWNAILFFSLLHFFVFSSSSSSCSYSFFFVFLFFLFLPPFFLLIWVLEIFLLGFCLFLIVSGLLACVFLLPFLIFHKFYRGFRHVAEKNLEGGAFPETIQKSVVEIVCHENPPKG